MCCLHQNSLYDTCPFISTAVRTSHRVAHMKKDCQEAMSGYIIAVYLYNTSWGIFLFVLAKSSQLAHIPYFISDM